MPTLMTRTLLASTLLMLAAAGPGLAQDRATSLREVPDNPRRGFWIGFGLGGGGEAFNVKGAPGGFTEAVWAPTGYLKLGGTVRQNLLLGAELFGWSDDDGSLDETLGSLMFIAQWYPARSGAFFVKGGIGVTAFSQEVAGARTGEEAGFGASLGVGYDIRVGRNISIVPSLDYIAHEYQDFRERIVNVGLGITFH